VSFEDRVQCCGAYPPTVGRSGQSRHIKPVADKKSALVIETTAVSRCQREAPSGLDTDVREREEEAGGVGAEKRRALKV